MATKKIKLVFVTTARSDYSTMYPVMKAALADQEIEAIIFCGGMHLVPEFGNTYKQLLEDHLVIHEKIDFMTSGDDALILTVSLGEGTKVFAEALVKHSPDFIVVSGDRIENLSLFTAATALRIPIAHMCGGDITEGAFDNQVRHAMTKLSHVHFVSMKEHYDRVVQMGEEPWRVIITGDAAIDTIVNFTPASREEFFKSQGLPVDRQIVLSTFHPLTLGSEDFVSQYKNVLTILQEAEEVPVLSYPNIDPGFKPLIALLENFIKKRPDALLKKSFSREQYYSLLHYAKYMIGNSSSGLWEAPSFALPNVNVGNRQAGRLRGANVIDVSGENLPELRAAVIKAKSPDFKKTLVGMSNPYGAGEASLLTLEVLKKMPKGDELLIKKFHAP